MSEQAGELDSVEASGLDVRGNGAKLSLSTVIPPNHLLRLEFAQTLSSKPGHISFLLAGGLYQVTLDQQVTPEGLLLSTNEPWIRPAPAQTITVHFECVFLRPDVFRVRAGLADYYPFDHPFPADSEFPPPNLRQSLFPGGEQEEPLVGAQRGDLGCGLQLRANDGDIWVNPRGSSFEIAYATSPFGLSGSHQALGAASNSANNAEHFDPVQESAPIPFFQHAPIGPFNPAMLPSGFLTLDNGTTLGTELLILQKDEIMHSSRLASSNSMNSTASAEGSHPQPIANPPFIYTNRGWGLLVKKPALVQTAGLSDGRKMLSLAMFAENGMVDYIVVRGKALQACLDEYYISNDEV